MTVELESAKVSEWIVMDDAGLSTHMRCVNVMLVSVTLLMELMTAYRSAWSSLHYCGSS